MNDIIKKQDTIEGVVSLLRSGLDSTIEACSALARLVRQDPENLARLKEAAPNVPPAFIAKMLRVGEKTMHPGLLLNSYAANAQLARLPLSIQERVIKTGSAEVVTDPDSGDFDRVSLVDLTPAQAKQVFADDGPRDKMDQRAWLKRHVTAQAQTAVINSIQGAAYVCRKSGVVSVLRPCELTRKELLRILEELG